MGCFWVALACTETYSTILDFSYLGSKAQSDRLLFRCGPVFVHFIFATLISFFLYLNLFCSNKLFSLTLKCLPLSHLFQNQSVVLNWITIPGVLFLFCLNHGLRMMAVDAVWSFHDLSLFLVCPTYFLNFFCVFWFWRNFIHLRQCYSSLL